MYTLDFETMKQVMQAHQKTGILTAETSAGVRGLRGPCRIEIILKTGAIVSCTLTGSNGARLTGRDAEQALVPLSRLNWTFTSQDETAPLQTRRIFTQEAKPLFPRRTMRVTQDQARNWPRAHRAIFALADGTKSVAKIAEMLSTSPGVVEGVLRDLQSIGVVVMGPQIDEERPDRM